MCGLVANPVKSFTAEDAEKDAEFAEEGPGAG